MSQSSASTKLQDAAVATGVGKRLNISGAEMVAFQVLITTTATVTFQTSIDGTNWVSLLVTNVTTGEGVTSTTASGVFHTDVPGLLYVRANITAWTAGAVTVYAVTKG